jgi:hypothetical protein
MVALAKTTMKNVNSFKSTIIYTPAKIGARLRHRNESTSTNSAGTNTNSAGTNTNSAGTSNLRWELTVKREAKGFMVNNITDMKSVEAELKGTIGKTLGRQGHKIVYAKQLMEKELQRYNDLIKLHSSAENAKFHPDIINASHNYHEYRRQALQAPWELIVQRQAAGFVVNNHDYVSEQYPIAAALPVHDLNNESSSMDEKSIEFTSSSVENDRKVKFTDQLRWWWDCIVRQR